MSLDPILVVKLAWVALGIIWLLAARNAKRAARRMPRGALIAHILGLVLAVELVFSDYFRVGFLRNRFVPADAWVGWVGCAVAMAGFAFALRARFQLGRNWSGTVQVKQDHTLERRGPYGLVRHPIYSGLSLAFVGTAVTIGEWRCLMGAALAFFEWKRKSQLEERFMIEQFGREYIEYRHQVKSLIPFVW
jgi:protein-S-isoprenylcysteine O-methyltransferase Ste14